MDTSGLPGVRIGDKIKFSPDNDLRKWWTVKARDENHLVAVRQAPFEEKGVVEYTVTEVRNYEYNGQGPGLVRSSLNTLGGFYGVGTNGEDADKVLEELSEGNFELSNRRVLNVVRFEVRND